MTLGGIGPSNGSPTYDPRPDDYVESPAPPSTEPDGGVVDPPRDAVEDVTGRFSVVRTLGSGGGGRVHLVRDARRTDVLRALKTALPLGAQDVAERADASARILH